jgi:signal transduction histidine kinase
VHPADRNQTRSTITEAARTASPFDFEERIVRADGDIRWLRSQGRWIGAPHDPTLKLVGICQDITDRKRIEEESRRAEALRVRNDELRAFAYMVSHDLRAPLRAVAGYARELDRQHVSGANQRADECVKQIFAVTGNLEQLIEDLLRYCRIEGEVPAQNDVSLDAVVAQVMRERWPPIGSEAEVSTDFEVTHVRVWQRGLVQIVANLVDNALKFSADATPPRVRISSRSLKDVVRVAVADNGIGFDMKNHDRIFGLFHRLDAEDRFEGTTGLAIVKKMADRMGAVVRAESSPGAGATFMVDLPKPKLAV